jgi:uncharacterized protein
VSGYDLGDVLMNLATGEAIVTVMNERGAPSPVAWTRLRAPQGSMVPTPADQMLATVRASPLSAKYAAAIDRESAREILAAKMNAAAAAAPEQVDQKYVEEWRAASSKKAPVAKTPAAKKRTTTRTTSRNQKGILDEVLGSRTSQTIVREVLRGVFSTLKKK